MNDEEKKEKLRRYLIAVDRLKMKCDDAARWESLSMGPSGGTRIRTGSVGPDEIKETAIQTRQECERLAVEVRGLRQQLDDALCLMKDDRLRGFIESKYIQGMSDRQMCEVYSYSKRHMSRLMVQAMHELAKCSGFFS